MILYIKNMVCPRCIAAVRTILEEEGIGVRSVVLGEAEIDSDIDAPTEARLAERFRAVGFELLEDRRSRVIEEVKCALVEAVSAAEPISDMRLSDYLSDRLHLDYKYLGTLFSETQGRTIGNYFIALKIERVKELLVYDELTLSEIAYRLGYSSVAHLSAQFRRVTGLTPSSYKRLGDRKRRSLDEV